MSNISILIIEDEGIVALDVSNRITNLGYDVAAIKNNSDKAINWLEINTPDLILCDIHIKGTKDGIDVAEYVQKHKRTPLIFVTALSDRVTLQRAKVTLPYGYIIKPFTTEDLLSAIEMALYKHSIELEKLAITKAKMDEITTAPLTTREYDLLVDITNGLNNQQITEARFISMATVKFHIRNLLMKLEAENRADALYKILTLLTK